MNKRVEIDPEEVVVSILENTTPKLGEIYRHHSGTIYQIAEQCVCADTGAPLVAYQKYEADVFGDYYRHGPRYIHTVANFLKPGRFERVKS